MEYVSERYFSFFFLAVPLCSCLKETLCKEILSVSLKYNINKRELGRNKCFQRTADINVLIVLIPF